jgi:hypothetical protein
MRVKKADLGEGETKISKKQKKKKKTEGKPWQRKKLIEL